MYLFLCFGLCIRCPRAFSMLGRVHTLPVWFASRTVVATACAERENLFDAWPRAYAARKACIPNGRSYGLRRFTFYPPSKSPSEEGDLLSRAVRVPCRACGQAAFTRSVLGAYVRCPSVRHVRRPFRICKRRTQDSSPWHHNNSSCCGLIAGSVYKRRGVVAREGAARELGRLVARDRAV